MLFMAKKTKQSQSGIESKKPYKSGGIQVYLGEDLHRIFMECLDGMRPRPSNTAVIRMLVEQFLEQKSLWPPPEE